MTEIVSVKLERALLVKIDALAGNRSDFIRQEVEEKEERASRKSRSAWDAMQGTESLKVRIKPVSGKVRRIDL